MYRRILVALKWSPVGRNALLAGIQLAKENQARLHIFHALDYRLMCSDAPDERILEMTRQAEDRFKAEFRPLLGDYKRFGFNCWEADPSVEICRLANEFQADLVIIGCHQRAGKRSVTRIGQAGLSVLESAPCSVLLVPCPRDKEING